MLAGSEGTEFPHAKAAPTRIPKGQSHALGRDVMQFTIVAVTWFAVSVLVTVTLV